RLVDNLDSFLTQDYSGPVQMVCGVGNSEDRALTAIATTRSLHPSADIAVSTGPRHRAANAKIGNILAMMPLVRSDVLVLSDSDMAVQRDYLTKLLGALDQPGIGAVTCLYVGRGDAGFWSRISALAMSCTGLPNMVMALATSIAQPCLGSTIAIRRETLAAIGGFERFADVLADDYAIGEAVASLGLKVAVPPMVLTHACAHRSLAELWHQHLRWSATIRAVAPMRHAGSGVTHALVFALLAGLFLPSVGAWLIVFALGVRAAIAVTVNRIASVSNRFIFLLPIADCLEFAVYISSLVTTKIDWRGSRLRIMGDGRIAHRTPETPD
ncbi:MAG: bacteriohopanetetrol glucosamine biosynthesis glycosyltransferase HpnI, partial [Novosphingobium sp.]